MDKQNRQNSRDFAGEFLWFLAKFLCVGYAALLLSTIASLMIFGRKGFSVNETEDFYVVSDRVLTEVVAPASRTKGGVLIPETAKKDVCYGKVLRVGPKQKEIKVGDVVVFSQYCGTEVEVFDKKCRVLENDNILFGIIGEYEESED